MEQILPAEGALPPRRVIDQGNNVVSYTTTQGDDEVQLHAAVQPIAWGRRWAQKVTMSDGALRGSRQKGSIKAGKHSRPVGSKITLADLDDEWSESPNRENSHIVYKVTRTCRCMVCVGLPNNKRVQVVTTFMFGHVLMHKVETTVVSGAIHVAEPGDDPALKIGTPADRKRIRDMREQKRMRPMGMFEAFDGRLSLAAIRKIGKQQKQRPKKLQGMSEAALFHYYMTKVSPGAPQGGKMIWCVR
jgi:hypothetical protein